MGLHIMQDRDLGAPRPTVIFLKGLSASVSNAVALTGDDCGLEESSCNGLVLKGIIQLGPGALNTGLSFWIESSTSSSFSLAFVSFNSL